MANEYALKEAFGKIKDEIESLKKQNLPEGEYAVFGSAVMAVRGFREAPNIDIIVTDKLWNEPFRFKLVQFFLMLKHKGRTGFLPLFK